METQAKAPQKRPKIRKALVDFLKSKGGKATKQEVIQWAKANYDYGWLKDKDSVIIRSLVYDNPKYGIKEDGDYLVLTTATVSSKSSTKKTKKAEYPPAGQEKIE
jgi:hypothetical protein